MSDYRKDGKLIFSRTVNGTAVANVPMFCHHHSPDGFEWGYQGSGPADLALNILHGLLVDVDETREKVWDGTEISGMAFRYHQAFKRDIVAGCPREGGELDMSVVHKWIKEKVGITLGE